MERPDVATYFPTQEDFGDIAFPPVHALIWFLVCITGFIMCCWAACLHEKTAPTPMDKLVLSFLSFLMAWQSIAPLAVRSACTGLITQMRTWCDYKTGDDTLRTRQPSFSYTKDVWGRAGDAVCLLCIAMTFLGFTLHAWLYLDVIRPQEPVFSHGFGKHSWMCYMGWFGICLSGGNMVAPLISQQWTEVDKEVSIVLLELDPGSELKFVDLAKHISRLAEYINSLTSFQGMGWLWVSMTGCPGVAILLGLMVSMLKHDNDKEGFRLGAALTIWGLSTMATLCIVLSRLTDKCELLLRDLDSHLLKCAGHLAPTEYQSLHQIVAFLHRNPCGAKLGGVLITRQLVLGMSVKAAYLLPSMYAFLLSLHSHSSC